MTDVRPDALRAPKVARIDAGAEAQLPARTHDAQSITRDAARPPRSWMRIPLRIVRDVAIAITLMAAIPVIVVARKGDQIWKPMERAARARNYALNAEVYRRQALPPDPSITALDAGMSFSRLQPSSRNAAFPEVDVGARADMGWMRTKLPRGMFPAARPIGFAGPSEAVVAAAVGGFTAEEMTYLRSIATASAWREFDRVARAPAVDLIAGRFRLPFATNASLLALPAPDYKPLRELANAALSRAAYNRAMGQRDSAEAILRSIISFGFALVDNATSTLDEVNGTAIVHVGGNALGRLWLAEGDPRGNWRDALPPKERRDPGRDASVEEIRTWLISRATDPKTSRGDRFHALQELTYASCTNVRETLLGPGADVTAAFGAARSSLTRFPSDRAVVDLGTRLPDASTISPSSISDFFTTSAATVAGVVLNNPRLATCSRIVGSYLYFR